MSSSHLDEGVEVWVALHLPACELQVVLLLPTVVLIGEEALRELETNKKRIINW